MAGKAASKCYKLTFFSTILAAVLLIFVLKLVFLITRYGITASSINCEPSAEDSNLTTAVKAKVNHEYIFTVIMYVIVNVLRIVEYLLLGKQFYFFLFQQEVVDPWTFFKKHSKRFCYLLLFFVILMPYFLLGFAIPGLGIYQEIEHTQQLAKCYRHYHEIYITYCAVNFLRYTSAFTVRIVMIYTALYIDKLWFPDGPPLHTSTGLVKSENLHRGNRHTSSRTYLEEQGCADNHDDGAETSGSDIIATPDLSSGNHTEIEHQPHTDCATSNQGSNTGASPYNNKTTGTNTKEHQRHTNCNAELFQKVLEDWKEVSTDFKERVENYNKTGKEVQIYQELFQSWFIVPWVIYFINTSLKTYHVLRPWNADGDGDTPPSNIPSIYYLLFNIIQFITLIVPFLCAKKINTYHQKYFKLRRVEQLKQYKDDPSRLSFARQLMVDENDRYDFEPRIWGTSITVSVGNPLFVVLLLVGLFLSVSESIL